jgi:hypothetical protein
LLITKLLSYKVANFTVAMVQSCYGTKLLRYKVANFKVAMAIKWVKVPNCQKINRKSAKYSKKLYSWAIIHQLAGHGLPSVQLDL